MKIRNDLVGAVVVASETGTPLILKAGDEVPEGVTVGDHVTVDEPTTTTDDDGQDDGPDDDGQDDGTPDDDGQDADKPDTKPEPKPKTRR